MKGSPSKSVKICTSLLAMIKGDISMARPISDGLNIEHEMIMPIIAAATGNIEVLSDFYEMFQIKFCLENVNSVRVISEVYNGKFDMIYELADQKSLDFNINDPEITEAMCYLTYIGQKIYRDKTVTFDGSCEAFDRSISTLAL
jgi:hypothetical protein